MKFSLPPRLIQYFQLRFPALVAAGFCIYLLALLSYSVYAWRQMKEEIDEYLLADVMRRVSSVADAANLILTRTLANAGLPSV